MLLTILTLLAGNQPALAKDVDCSPYKNETSCNRKDSCTWDKRKKLCYDYDPDGDVAKNPAKYGSGAKDYGDAEEEEEE